MREILFKGKTEQGEWVEGFYTKGFRYPQQEQLNDIIYIFSRKLGEWGFDYALVIPETVGQFTGLTDKNGEKIFEGDIVSIKESWGKYAREYREVVKWELNGFYPFADSPENCGHCGGAYNSSESEVIGNIHDNKELLKE